MALVLGGCMRRDSAPGFGGFLGSAPTSRRSFEAVAYRTGA